MAMTNFTSADMNPKKPAPKAAKVEPKAAKKFKKFEEPIIKPAEVVEETSVDSE